MENTVSGLLFTLLIAFAVSAGGHLVLRLQGVTGKKLYLVPLGGFLLIALVITLFIGDTYRNRAGLQDYLHRAQSPVYQVRWVAAECDEASPVLCKGVLRLKPELLKLITRAEPVSFEHAHPIRGVRFEFEDPELGVCPYHLTWYQATEDVQGKQTRQPVLAIGDIELTYGMNYSGPEIENVLGRVLEQASCEEVLERIDPEMNP